MQKREMVAMNDRVRRCFRRFIPLIDAKFPLTSVVPRAAHDEETRRRRVYFCHGTSNTQSRQFHKLNDKNSAMVYARSNNDGM